MLGALRLWRIPLWSSASWSKRLTSVSLFENEAWNNDARVLFGDGVLKLAEVRVLDLPPPSRNGGIEAEFFFAAVWSRSSIF